MRRLLALAAAAAVAASAAYVQAQPAPPSRPKVEVLVLTLDDITQRQARYGRASVAWLGDARWGAFDYVAPSGEAPASCQDDGWREESLDHCVRFYARRMAAKVDHPLVVVVLDDLRPGAPRGRGGELSARCYGGGDRAAHAARQSIRLWPDAERVHGMRDLEEDRAALVGCITAAAAEPKAPPAD